MRGFSLLPLSIRTRDFWKKKFCFNILSVGAPESEEKSSGRDNVRGRDFPSFQMRPRVFISDVLSVCLSVSVAFRPFSAFFSHNRENLHENASSASWALFSS